MKRTLTVLALLAGLASQNSLADFGTLSPSASTWTGTYKDTQGGLHA
jgi:hypothetical protein